MAPASNEEQFKFLISCIRYSNNGKVDFGEVAKECAIVSKGAAAKRYERMMRSHGIAPNAATIKPAPSRNPKTENRESSTTATAPTGAVSKKRKADQFIEDNTTADDEEGFGTPNIKADPAKEKKPQMRVKEEAGGALSLGEAANLMQFYNTPSYPASGSHLGEDYVVGSDYDGSSAGYHTPMGSSYGLQAQQGFDFSGALGASEIGMNGMSGIGGIPRSADQGLSYEPYQYSPDSHGGSESPVIVE